MNQFSADSHSILPPGAKFRRALEEEKPLLIAGAVNAYCAVLAEKAGFRALYLSGGGVAACMGMPDLAATTMHDVAADAERITAATSLPLLVDADTGFGSWLNIARAVKTFARAGAAGMHLEDQAQAKRCGHRPNKILVSAGEMCDRIRAAVDARGDGGFVIMARTDALASEPREAALERARLYAEAGADMIFAEAAKTLDDYRDFRRACGAPVLANITEFGETPMFSAEELRGAGADMMLFPLSAFRAMNRAAEKVYAAIRKDGGQKSVTDMMQTRAELYANLNYHDYEEKMDSLFGKPTGEKS
ncbi:MAG: methylisocitrate lyase [Gammaproteobacteria bacterium]